MNIDSHTIEEYICFMKRTKAVVFETKVEENGCSPEFITISAKNKMNIYQNIKQFLNQTLKKSPLMS